MNPELQNTYFATVDPMKLLHGSQHEIESVAHVVAIVANP